MKSRIRSAFVIGAAISTPLMAAPAALADATENVGVYSGVTSCPSDGNPGGGQRCTTIGNGVLSVRGDSDHATVNYYRKSGGNLSARLGVERNGNNTWAAYQNMSNTPFHYTKVFTFSPSCASLTGKLNTSSAYGGDTYPTPPLPTC